MGFSFLYGYLILSTKFFISSLAMHVFHHEGKIVGGFPVKIEDFPYQVSLQQPTHFCGGSLIGTDWVLSAAHCGS